VTYHKNKKNLKAIHNISKYVIYILYVVTYHKNKKNLKAIHNSDDTYRSIAQVVTYHKNNKFESNSQLFINNDGVAPGCDVSQK
jgi:hypothetical protein